MVSVLSIMFMILTIIICFGVPIGLALYLTRKTKFAMRALSAGVLAFVVSQLLIRIPLLGIVVETDFYKGLGPIALSLFIGLSAALFETAGRIIFTKLMLKGKETYYTGIAHGVGHGGIEAIALVGVLYINNLIYSFMINNGTFLSTYTPAGTSSDLVEIFENARTALVETSSYMFFLGGFERFLTIIIHIGLSLLVMEGFMKKKTVKYSLIAVLIHTMLDGGGVLMRSYGASFVVLEIYTVLIAVVLLVYIVLSRKRLANVVDEKAVESQTIETVGENENDYWKAGVVYINRKDKRLLVDKKIGIGKTVNFGNPWSIVIILVFIAFIVATIVGTISVL